MCGTDDCFAVDLAVDTGHDEDARPASEVSQLARDAAQGEGRAARTAGGRCVSVGTAGGA
ncbi:hypothetical protein GCM10010276_22230 [Streptomyces longisporus]|uniref:Uncharacterized protein n=1 Tax=Streptomyces longisporus TaxID=1948 RepID=A0ABP5YNA4_STRLO